MLLHPLSDFLLLDIPISIAHPTYWYEGSCPVTGVVLRLPRTALAEAIARGLMQRLSRDPPQLQDGKMYGILLVQTATGKTGVLQAFSGLLNGQPSVPGWVPPLPGRAEIFLMETLTLQRLEAIKQELLTLNNLSERQQYAACSQEFEHQLQQLGDRHARRKQERDRQRIHGLQTLAAEAFAAAMTTLEDQSRRDGMERRDLKRQRDRVLSPLQSAIAQADARIRALKQQRKILSRQLQAQMHASYRLTNFTGESLAIAAFGALPTGTGDCCAPKLLHYAASQAWQPLAMAEFWWGAPSANGDKQPGEFYPACRDRCQPLMGFLLSGLHAPPVATLPASLAVPVVYEDDWLMAVNKPSGLLSVPGRRSDRQESVLSRLQRDIPSLFAVHRLDQDTSGILLLAKDLPTYRAVSRQFQQRQTHKVYEAVLDGVIPLKQGVIELPLWADPGDRPYQKVDWQRGKPSVTQFQVLAQTNTTSRVECLPETGRTHQIRVHAAHALGLAAPILGDRLYGWDRGDRLHLHARELHVQHPHTGNMLYLNAKTPF